MRNRTHWERQVGKVSRNTGKRLEAGAGLSLAVCLALGMALVPASAQARRSCEEIEAFMRRAKMTAPKGLTVVMDDGTMQHRVFLHTHDESYTSFQNRDTWKANVAAYELGKILEINMMPPYVEGRVEGKPASLSWGLDNVMMNELQKKNGNIQPPDPEGWNRQMYVVRVFEELINNLNPRIPVDLLITRDWQAWILAPSQAFRPSKTLQDPQSLVKCDRKLLAKMRMLDKEMLMRRLGNWLTGDEIDALAARAGMIVEWFDKEVAAKGEASVLFDLDRSGVPCAL